MQYPKQNYEVADRSAELLREAFETIDEILLLFQDQGIVVEINKLADECCHRSHNFNVGDLIWNEKLWLSELDRRQCYNAFQGAATGRKATFFAQVKNRDGEFVKYQFSIIHLNARFESERYFLLCGQKAV